MDPTPWTSGQSIIAAEPRSGDSVGSSFRPIRHWESLGMENSKEGAQAEAVRCKMAWCGKPKRKSRPKHESESPGKHPLSSWPACVGFVRVQLCRLASTFWGDPARSLFEFYRAAIGEIPYRDFTLPYPPLAIALISPVL